MTALPPQSAKAMSAILDTACEPRDRLVSRWRDLSEQANEVALMAELQPDDSPPESDAFFERLAAAGPAQMKLVRETLEDIDAMMQPGITALRVVAARGQDVTAPALALWREFYAARAALMTVLEVQRGVVEHGTS